jgi:hypothetical protein
VFGGISGSIRTTLNTIFQPRITQMSRMEFKHSHCHVERSETSPGIASVISKQAIRDSSLRMTTRPSQSPTDL